MGDYIATQVFIKMAFNTTTAKKKKRYNFSELACCSLGLNLNYLSLSF